MGPEPEATEGDEGEGACGCFEEGGVCDEDLEDFDEDTCGLCLEGCFGADCACLEEGGACDEDNEDFDEESGLCDACLDTCAAENTALFKKFMREDPPATGDDATPADDATTGDEGGDDATPADDATTGDEGGDDATPADDATTGDEGGDDATTEGGDDTATEGGDDAATEGGDGAATEGGDDTATGGDDATDVEDNGNPITDMLPETNVTNVTDLLPTM